MEYMKNTLRDAGLTDSDFARLLGVSRVTVYQWGKGTEPHRMIRDKYKETLDAIDRATQNGALPIPERRKDERAAQLRDIVEQYS